MTTSPPSSRALDPALLKLAGIVLLGAIAAQLDSTIVSVAIATLGRDLHAPVSTIQWVSTGYLLAMAVMLPVSGWAVLRFGAKPMWLAALAAFLAGSMLCGAAWSTGSLIAFRIVQGIGAGMLIPLMQTILAQAAGPARLGRLMSVIAVPITLAPVLGPVIGGLIVSHASWRWIFYLNLPVCLAALVLAWRGMPDGGRRARQRLDGLGLALLSPALAAIVYGCSRAGSHGGFGDPGVLACLAIGLALAAAFALHALRSRVEPLIDLRLFRARAFSGTSALMLLFGGSLFGAMLLLPLYYQQVRGQSALDAGLLLAPQGLGMMLALTAVGRVGDRLGARATVLTGLVLAALGTFPYTLVGSGVGEGLLGAALVVRGAGLGAAIVPIMSAAYHGLERDEYPRATTAVRIFQQVGGSLGTALLAVILQHQAVAHPGHLGTAFGHTFTWTLAVTALAAVPAVLLPGRRIAARDRSADPANPPAGAPAG